MLLRLDAGEVLPMHLEKVLQVDQEHLGQIRRVMMPSEFCYDLALFGDVPFALENMALCHL